MALKIHGTDNIQAGTVQTQVLASGVGGGPKITGIAVTDSSYTNIDDTAVGLSGGYIKITGTGFVSGCSIIVGATVATSVSFINSTEVRAQVPAQSAGSYTVYLVNSDGGVGIRVNGLNYSSTPTWTTTSPLGDGAIDTAISIQLAATSNSAVTYALQAGNTLPAGLSLSSGGLLSGTVTGITVDTTYNFTVVASDQESQDTPQAFSITISVNDPYFKNTVLLLQADTAPTIISDASSNNFDLTVVGDARASNFTPYGGAWSNYFDGNGDYLSLANNAAFDMGSSDFTIDCWFYLTADASPDNDGLRYATIFSSGPSTAVNSTDYSISVVGNTTTTGTGIGFGGRNSGTLYNLTYTTTITKNIWHYVCVVRSGSTLTLYYDGTQVAQNTSFTSNVNTGGNQIRIGALAWFPSGQNYAYYFPGYISAIKVVKGVANTPSGVPSTPPTQSTGTSLLTCNANRFLDSSSNGFAITRNGDAKIASFNPFNITNTSVNGSAYFDGTGDYLTIPSNNAFVFGTGDFTIESWTYLTAAPASPSGSIVANGGNSNVTTNITFILSITSALVPSLYIGTSTTPSITLNSPTAITIGAWNHIAATRSGNTFTLWLNGVSVATGTSSVNISALLDVFVSKAYSDLDSRYITGYISDLRLTKGTAVYTANFTPPTQPLTAIANTQLLTLQYDQPHNNHTFLDASSNQFVVTRSGNTTQGTFSPFSQTGWGNYFDGTTDNLKVSNNAAFQFGTTAFTIEFWVYLTTTSGSPQLICCYQNSSTGYNIRLDASAVLLVNLNGDGANITGTTTVQANQWNHIALSGTGGTSVKLFLNGVQEGSTFTGATSLSPGTYPFTIGSFAGGGFGDSNFITGYMSNVRVVKGTAVYTGNFTPPSLAPLTTAGSTSAASYPSTTNVNTSFASSETSLLTCQSNRFRDASNNNFTITRNGDTRVVAFSPFNPTVVYNPAVHGGSAYFDRTGDFLSLATNNSFDFGTGNFTVELFYYPLAYDDIQMFFSGTSNYQFGYSASDSRNLYYYGSSSNVISGTPASSMLLNQWNHIVLVRSGTSLAIMSNGVRQGTATHSSSVNFSGSPIVGGYADSTASYAIRGYMAGFRAVKGVAIYDPTQTTYTVPTAPVTATTNTSLLLNFTDAAMRDSRGLAVLETVGDAKTSTVQVKYGTGSMRFDGTGDYLIPNISTSDLYTFGTGAFTVEFWLYLNSTSGVQICIDFRPLATNGPQIILFTNAGVLTFQASSTVRITGSTLSTGQWYHIALSRSGTDTKMFLNGIQTGSTYTSDTTSYTVGANRPAIGADGANLSLNNLNGYIDDLRITKGYARYTQNFTPPTAKFLAK